MREILFRGKRVDNGEWVCSGNLIHFNEYNECHIPTANSGCTCTHDENNNIIEWKKVMFCKVLPKTVGQFTGLTDKNGNKIFEGDIVRLTFSEEVVGKIICDVNYYIESDIFGRTTRKLLSDYISDNLEIIGNIHDNPELLGGAE